MWHGGDRPFKFQLTSRQRSKNDWCEIGLILHEFDDDRYQQHASNIDLSFEEMRKM